MKKLASPRALRLLPVTLLLALTLPACLHPVGVTNTGFGPVYQGFRKSVLDHGSLGTGGEMLLEYFGLEQEYLQDPEATVLKITEIAQREGLRSFHPRIAEMHYEIALRTGDRSRFLAAALHAYIYLFGEGFVDEPNPFAPRYRLACDLYNRGLAQALRGPGGDVVLEDLEVETPIGKVKIVNSRPGFPWDEEEFSTFLPADTYTVRGLRERNRQPGLGMPLIAVQSGGGTSSALSAEHVGREIKLPATAFLRLHGGMEELEAGELEGTLELYLSTDTPSVFVGEEEVPLQTDITAPLAYMLETSKLWEFGIQGFKRGFTKDQQTGVFMLQPYQRDKVPLVLIHGTASSPAAWAQTINGIFADQRLSSRYQVWLAMYNTGNPIAYSAAHVRDALRDLVAALDPEGTDEILSQMVLVGHSQGGLVSRLLVTSGGDRIWSKMSEKPLEDYELSDENRQLLQRCIYFEPLPFVDRVVFISTPHKGSYVAGGWIGGLAKRMVSLPKNLLNTAQSMLERNQLPPALRTISTSVDNMDPGSSFVQILGELPFAEDMRLNSIVAVRPRHSDVTKGNDGVVLYTSAHLEEAESELVVRMGHSCQGATETVGELRRILFEHIDLDRTEAHLEPMGPEPPPEP